MVISINLYFQYKIQDDIEKILLQRYKEAEREEPGFVKKEGIDVFVIWYYAGHGCMDKEQYFVLNEQNI